MEQKDRDLIEKSLKLKKVGQKCQECGSTRNRVTNRTDITTKCGWTPAVFLACDWCGFITHYATGKLTYFDPEQVDPNNENNDKLN